MAVLIAAFGVVNVVHAAPPPRVGVVVSTGVNLSPEALEDLSARVGEALADVLLVDVTAGREVTRRLAPESFGQDCFLDKACPRTVARRLDVEQLLVLFAVRVGTQLQIEPTWIDVESGRAVVRDAIKTDSVKEDLSKVLRASASRLLPDAELRPSPEPQIATTQTGTVATPSETTSLAGTKTPTVAAPRGPPISSWVAFGIGGAALAAGVGLGVSAKADYDALDADGCRQVACDPDRIDAVDDKALAADVLFGVAGASVIIGGLLWWLDAPDKLAAGVAPTPDGVQGFVGGRF